MMEWVPITVAILAVAVILKAELRCLRMCHDEQNRQLGQINLNLMDLCQRMEK